VLIDKFVEDAFEFDVDAVYDGHDLLLGRHYAAHRGSRHSFRDSACVLPPYLITTEQLELIERYTHELARALKVKGLINVQYAMRDGKVYVLEVNPRASVPCRLSAKPSDAAGQGCGSRDGRPTLKKMGLTRRLPHRDIFRLRKRYCLSTNSAM